MSGIVFSTDPAFKLPTQETETITLPADQQKLKVFLDKKQRAGKLVTLITGFEGKTKDLEELGKKLKTYCGTGGSVKDGNIIVQGDNKVKVFDWLSKNNFSVKC